VLPPSAAGNGFPIRPGLDAQSQYAHEDIDRRPC
jgi:hypothetical protein